MVSSDCRRVQRAWRYIRDHYTNPRLWVKDGLKFTGLSRRQLEFAFRKRLGRSVKQELVRVRVQRAKALLAATPMRIDDIAAMSGFLYPKKFFRTFRLLVGLTPRAYRASQGFRICASTNQALPMTRGPRISTANSDASGLIIQSCGPPSTITPRFCPLGRQVRGVDVSDRFRRPN